MRAFNWGRRYFIFLKLNKLDFGKEPALKVIGTDATGEHITLDDGLAHWYKLGKFAVLIGKIPQIKSL